ncbi:LysR family transcriptional regulator [Agrobacterium vitis]|uniref:LysR family transcriptional regulator n=1 Tax=Rhizobium/Agrobacterium group TaxID=227290 RepID=UPI0008DC08DD|nr:MULTISPECIES: LysR family transcriptional regulator [Rhizobium/Agrobacterium group]MCF1436590.1 LysR family transcriptional regulator [Allorhizobium ampelinum]MUO91888.1 LysR family transcriptional regulator [Agrobacterium vitis]MUZ55332.1 LysR family transcriptional regulator [Agrobacterium vitis]MUZ94557.1 LysR family transcriptional regulator [Agrobacterium vitis]MVA42876.1 LysR family transcriptional regulator [Agrobacterium vitis]
MDRFTALKVFCAVIEARSFTKAGNNIGLSRPAISKNIRELEAHVGVTLVNRTTRGVMPSEAGSRYYQIVSELLWRHEQADEVASQSGAELRGTLRVTMPVTLGLHLILPVLPQFNEENPECSLDLCLSEEKQQLVEGNFDVAVRASQRLEDSTLMSRCIGSVTYAICAAPSYVQKSQSLKSPKDLEDHQLVVHGANIGDQKWRFSAQGESCYVSVRAQHKSNCSEAIKSLTVAGMGIARIPRPYVSRELAEGRLVELLSDWAMEPLTIYAMYPQSNFLPRRTRLFIDFMSRALKVY